MEPEQILDIIAEHAEIARVFNLLFDSIGTKGIRIDHIVEYGAPSLRHHAARCELLGIENILPHEPTGGTNGFNDEDRTDRP